MFFLKPKPKIDEVLPPPPPEAEFEEQTKEETETFTEEKEIGDLAKDLDIELEPQKEVRKKEKTVQKAKVTKKQKIQKKIELKKPISIKTTKDKSLPSKKIIPIKQIKEEKTILKKPIKTVKKEAKKIEVPKSKEKPDISKEINLTKAKTLPEDKEFEDLFKEVKALKPKVVKKEIELPEPKTSEEFELPETLEDFGKDSKQEKPTEILEAEEEIKSAIDKIKKQEKTSFFKRLFSRKEKVQEKPIEEHLMPELPEVNQISIIQNNINKAKDALIKFDLETAKKNYIEIMKIYNTIKPEEQSKVYHDIKDLYFERKSAEGLKA